MLRRRASSLLMLWSFLYLILGRFFQFLVLLGRGHQAKEIEILALRHQVAILRRRVNRPDLNDGDRVLLAALSRLLPRVSWNAFFVTPATLLRWHRGLVAQCRCLCAAKQFMVTLWWCGRWNRHASMGGLV